MSSTTEIHQSLRRLTDSHVQHLLSANQHSKSSIYVADNSNEDITDEPVKLNKRKAYSPKTSPSIFERLVQPVDKAKLAKQLLPYVDTATLIRELILRKTSIFGCNLHGMNVDRASTSMILVQKLDAVKEDSLKEESMDEAHVDNRSLMPVTVSTKPSYCVQDDMVYSSDKPSTLSVTEKTVDKVPTSEPINAVSIRLKKPSDNSVELTEIPDYNAFVKLTDPSISSANETSMRFESLSVGLEDMTTNANGSPYILDTNTSDSISAFEVIEHEEEVISTSEQETDDSVLGNTEARAHGLKSHVVGTVEVKKLNALLRKSRTAKKQQRSAQESFSDKYTVTENVTESVKQISANTVQQQNVEAMSNRKVDVFESKTQQQRQNQKKDKDLEKKEQKLEQKKSMTVTNLPSLDVHTLKSSTEIGKNSATKDNPLSQKKLLSGSTACKQTENSVSANKPSLTVGNTSMTKTSSAGITIASPKLIIKRADEKITALPTHDEPIKQTETLAKSIVANTTEIGSTVINIETSQLINKQTDAKVTDLPTNVKPTEKSRTIQTKSSSTSIKVEKSAVVVKPSLTVLNKQTNATAGVLLVKGATTVKQTEKSSNANATAKKKAIESNASSVELNCDNAPPTLKKFNTPPQKPKVTKKPKEKLNQPVENQAQQDNATDASMPSTSKSANSATIINDTTKVLQSKKMRIKLEPGTENNVSKTISKTLKQFNISQSEIVLSPVKLSHSQQLTNTTVAAVTNHQQSPMPVEIERVKQEPCDQPPKIKKTVVRRIVNSPASTLRIVKVESTPQPEKPSNLLTEISPASSDFHGFSSESSVLESPAIPMSVKRKAGRPKKLSPALDAGESSAVDSTFDEQPPAKKQKPSTVDLNQTETGTPNRNRRRRADQSIDYHESEDIVVANINVDVQLSVESDLIPSATPMPPKTWRRGRKRKNPLPDASLSGFVKQEPSEEIISEPVPIPAQVTCGNCHEIVLSNQWTKHLRTHYGLAWRVNVDYPIVST